MYLLVCVGNVRVSPGVCALVCGGNVCVCVFWCVWVMSVCVSPGVCALVCVGNVCVCVSWRVWVMYVCVSPGVCGNVRVCAVQGVCCEQSGEAEGNGAGRDTEDHQRSPAQGTEETSFGFGTFVLYMK